VLDASRIRHRELRLLFAGKPAKVDARWKRKLERMLSSLNVMVSPDELALYRCHALHGDRAGTYALHVSPNWRLTFRWDAQGPYDVDLEDYHG
jgi:proteic killer suppression protein